MISNGVTVTHHDQHGHVDKLRFASAIMLSEFKIAQPNSTKRLSEKKHDILKGKKK
jgi:hypothetical protein